MSIELSEEIISLREAASLIPRRRAGRKANVSTLYRWTQKGLRGIRLESIQIGGTRCTSRQALKRFFDRLGADEPGVIVTPRRKVRHNAELAARELEQMGV